MSDEMTVFALVAGAFLVVASGAAGVIRFLMAENRQLRGELLLGYRRATMPVIGGVVPEAGEPDVPLTAEVKKAIDEAYGLRGFFPPAVNLIDQDQFGAQHYPDPTDALLPDPDPMDGANRVSMGDDPSWPFQGGVERF